ncbi:MAG: CCA tRNA nucleotidyltransferase, partial [Rhodospirillaceae bacterium]
MGSRYRNESDPKDSPTAQRQAGILKGAKEHEPVGQLPPQPWWQSPEVKRLFQALTPEDQPALAPRFVGGSVRDALIGAGKAGDGISAVIADLDVATPLEPDQSCAALEAAGIRWIGTGLSHGTVTAVVDGQTFEVTSLRRDVACDGRHADVEFTRSWREDASRRDFTVNALSADGQGWVYDYFDGIADLHARHIRFIGRASDRIQEDYLRILRFFRFHARLGIGYPNGEGMAACAQLRDGLDSLSIERVRTEILKLLAAPDPVPSLLAMRDAGVLERVLPEGETVPLLRMVVFLEDRGVMAEGVGPDPLRRLGALVGCGAVDRSTADQTNLVEQLSRRWKLSRAEQARLSALAGV